MTNTDQGDLMRQVAQQIRSIVDRTQEELRRAWTGYTAALVLDQPTPDGAHQQIAHLEGELATAREDLDLANLDKQALIRDRQNAQAARDKALQDTRTAIQLRRTSDDLLAALRADLVGLITDIAQTTVGGDGPDRDAILARLRTLVAAGTAGDTGQAMAVNGVMAFMRSDSDTCICCEGRHVFARKIEGVDWHGRVYDALRRVPEGAQVRIDVSWTSAPATPQTPGGCDGQC